MRDYLINKDATFSIDELCTIGAALERSIEHGKNGIKAEMEKEKPELYIIDMYMKHISMHVRAFNALCVNKEDRTPYNYFGNLVFDEEAVAKLQEMIDAASNDALADNDGHVHQIWQDGEITSQKAGSLLWQRSLHQVDAGLEGVKLNLKWSHTNEYTGNSYIFCTELDAKKIRVAMLNIFIKALLG